MHKGVFVLSNNCYNICRLHETFAFAVYGFLAQTHAASNMLVTLQCSSAIAVTGIMPSFTEME